VSDRVETPNHSYSSPASADYGSSNPASGSGYGYDYTYPPSSGDPGPGSSLSLETVAGFYASPQVTVRAGYLAYRSFTASTPEHRAEVSIVWAHRWF
jgi:hypothetical protein